MKKIITIIAVISLISVSCKKETTQPTVYTPTVVTLDTNYNTVNVSYSCPIGSTMNYLVDGTIVNAPNNRIEVLRGVIFKLILVKPYTDNSKQLSFTFTTKSNKTLQVIEYKQDHCYSCDTLTYIVQL
jgi:hypothetical protein